MEGLNQQSQPAKVSVSLANHSKYNLTAISLRILAQPISATKIKLTLRVAPVPHKTILKQDDSSDVGFLIIEVHHATVDIFPPENKDDHHGIGFQPYILDMSKRTRKTWEDSIAKGDWSVRDSSKVWPSLMESDEEEENEASNISGGYNYYTYREKPHL